MSKFSIILREKVDKDQLVGNLFTGAEETVEEVSTDGFVHLFEGNEVIVPAEFGDEK